MMKAVRGEPPSSRGGNQSSVTESWVTLLARSLPEGGPGFSVTHTQTLVLMLSPLPVSLHHITLGSHFEYLRDWMFSPNWSPNSFGRHHLKVFFLHNVVIYLLHSFRIFSFADCWSYITVQRLTIAPHSEHWSLAPSSKLCQNWLHHWRGFISMQMSTTLSVPSKQRGC